MSLEFRDSSLMREVSAVLNSGANPVHYTVEAFLVANGQSYRCMQVLSLDLDRDYVGRFHDAPIMQAIMEQGVFFTSIHPYMDALECVFRQTPIEEAGPGINNQLPVQEERYTAILHQQGSPLLENNANFTPTQTTLDLTGIHQFFVELIPAAAHQVRLLGASTTVLRACTPEQAVRAILTQESAGVQVQSTQAITGVDIVPSNNQKPRAHITIPHGIMLSEIPAWIHEQCGGLYSAGLGYYLQGKTWYVYPLYDPVRNSQQAPTVTIINIPKNQFVGIERTYAQVGDHTTVLATGDVKFEDHSTVRQLNKGSGSRWTDADSIMGGDYIQTAENKSVAFRAKGNFEILTAPRPDGMNLTRVSPKATTNPYLEYAKLAENNGARLTLSWTNSDPDLIKPGILVRVLYLNQGQVATLQGVVLRAQHYRRLAGKGFANTRFVTDTAVTMFIQRPMSTGFSTPGTINTLPGATDAAAAVTAPLAAVASVAGAVSSVSTGLSSAITGASNVFSRAASTVSGAVSGITSAATGAASSIESGVSGAVSSVSGDLGSLASSVKSAIAVAKTTVNTVNQTTRAVSGIVNQANAASNSIKSVVNLFRRQ